MTNQSRAARIEAAARAFLTAFDDEKGRHYDEVMAADALRIALALPADPQPEPCCPWHGAPMVKDYGGKLMTFECACELNFMEFGKVKRKGEEMDSASTVADPQPVAMAEVMGKVLSYIRESVMEFVGTNRDGVTYWRADPDRVIASFNGAIDRAAAKVAQHQETTMGRPKIEGCTCPPCSGEPPRTDTTRINELLDRVGRSRDLVGESDMIDGDIWSMQCVLKEVWQALPACRNALDLLGVALTDHNHQWTDEQRTAYDTATEWLNKLWPERKQ